LDQKRKPIFAAEYYVYWSETDAAQLVHFSNYFRICERAEEDFWRSLGLKFDTSYGLIFPRVHASCDYRSPLHPGDRFRVEIVNIVLGNTSLTYFFRIFNITRDRLAAECRIVATAYSIEKQETIPIPVEVRKLLLERGAEERPA